MLLSKKTRDLSVHLYIDPMGAISDQFICGLTRDLILMSQLRVKYGDHCTSIASILLVWWWVVLLWGGVVVGCSNGCGCVMEASLISHV